MFIYRCFTFANFNISNNSGTSKVECLETTSVSYIFSFLLLLYLQLVKRLQNGKCKQFPTIIFLSLYNPNPNFSRNWEIARLLKIMLFYIYFLEGHICLHCIITTFNISPISKVDCPYTVLFPTFLAFIQDIFCCSW